MTWIEAVPLSALPAGRMVPVELNGTRVVLVRVGESLTAFRDECTHERCELSEGYLEGDQVECPCHGAVFDIVSGTVIAGPAVDRLAVYSTSVAGGTVSVEMP